VTLIYTADSQLILVILVLNNIVLCFVHNIRLLCDH